MEKNENAFAELQGRVQAIELALTTLLTTHPNPAEIRDSIREIAAKSARGIQDEPGSADFLRGWNSALSMLTRDYTYPPNPGSGQG